MSCEYTVHLNRSVNGLQFILPLCVAVNGSGPESPLTNSSDVVLLKLAVLVTVPLVSSVAIATVNASNGALSFENGAIPFAADYLYWRFSSGLHFPTFSGDTAEWLAGAFCAFG